MIRFSMIETHLLVIPISSLENLLNEVAEDEENRLYIVFKSSNGFLKRNSTGDAK